MQPFVWLALWQGMRWLATGRRRSLVICAVACGLALYAKLLALWVIGPFLLLLGLGWLARWRQGQAPPLDRSTVAAAVVAGVVPLLPLVWFNWQTGGTWQALAGHATQSYYGVDNRALLANGGVRLAQLVQSVRGDAFWYLGGRYANLLAPWLAALGIGAGVARQPRRMAVGLALGVMVFAASLVTISDLFVTHYALVQPLVAALAAGGYGVWLESLSPAWGRKRVSQKKPAFLGRGAAAVLLAVWVLFDLRATLLYHQALARSGGLADHSDATYHLAYYLRTHGMAAPLALDWGIDAPVRFLSRGTVRPIELFGYASPEAPDADFANRLASFLANPDNVYLLRAPAQTVFEGRRAVFLAAAEAHGGRAELIESFAQRDGTPLFEVWHVQHP
jgi:4-amino-4-deoxy-L-arabinose transferase-like glycosyltransferase